MRQLPSLSGPDLAEPNTAIDEAERLCRGQERRWEKREKDWVSSKVSQRGELSSRVGPTD